MNLLDALNRRYAVKRFSDQTLDPTALDTLLQAIRLSPAAFGLQPYRLLLLDDTQLRAALLPHSMGQDKVLHCSHLLVFAACREVGPAQVAQLIDQLAQQRNEQRDRYIGLEQHIDNYLAALGEAERAAWADQQLYIALGTALTSAALLDIDCCPMTGIDPAGYDQVLQLHSQGLRTVAVCALGQRHPDDCAARQLKVRLPAAELIRVGV